MHDSVKEYYGSTLQTSSDLKTNACCTGSKPPKYIADALRQIHPTVLSKYYGCGLCLPDYDLTGLSVLDLGCGAGRDVYLASQLVGPTGRVVGVDMTPAQLDTAREYQDFHKQAFGYDNVQFLHGYLEQLDEIAELQADSFDVIISNCVLNLCTDKAKVLKSCYKLLKPNGGELYFSDIYSTRRVPKVLQEDKVLWGECLSGALYWNDFRALAHQAGFPDVRLVEDAPVTVANAAVAQSIAAAGQAHLQFVSATYRLYKHDQLEPACEDYGQAVVYRGTIPRAPSSWRLDANHVFETGRIVPACGNTLLMLQTSPLAKHFTVYGTFDTHFGIFEGCGTVCPYQSVQSVESNSKSGISTTTTTTANGSSKSSKEKCGSNGKKGNCC